MSSDWQDTNAVWHDSNQDPPLQSQQSQAAPDPEEEVLLEEEEDVEEPSEQPLTAMEAAGALLRQLSPVLAPLLFGGITFLFILPFVLNHKAYAADGLQAGLILLIVGIILLIFAIGQGVVLYYAGSNDVLWSFGMIGGFSLFLLTGCFVIFPTYVGFILLAALLLIGVLLARFCIHSTPEGQVDIVQAFGKHSRTLVPGVYFVPPWEKIVAQLNTRETVWTCPRQRVPVSRSEEVHYAASISYQLMPEDAHIAAFYVNNWEKSLQELFVSTSQSTIEELSPEDFIAWSHAAHARQGSTIAPGDAPGPWDRINNMLAQRVQDQVAHWGVQINWIRIRDISVDPHIPGMAGVSPLASPQGGTVSASETGAPRTGPAQTNAASIQANQSTVEMPHPKMPPPPPPEAASAPPATAPAPAVTPARIPRIEALTEAYEAVRMGRITDPATIRDIAARFETIASDREKSQQAEFDAGRAARTLYERADLYEKQFALVDEYGNATQPDWSVRRASDDNLMAGG